MPHIVLEYSANLAAPVDFRGLFAEFHRILCEEGGVRIGNCKSRAVRRDDYLIGDGDPRAAFVHAEVRVASGRSSRWAERIGGLLLECLRAAYAPEQAGHDLQITVRMCELDRERYFKHPEGTLTPVADLDAKA